MEKAKRKIRELKIKNVEILRKDFRRIDERFDKIIFTAGILQGQENIIKDYADKHLRKKGVLICPRRNGRLMIFEMTDEGIRESWTDEEYNFVKLIL